VHALVTSSREHALVTSRAARRASSANSSSCQACRAVIGADIGVGDAVACCFFYFYFFIFFCMLYPRRHRRGYWCRRCCSLLFCFYFIILFFYFACYIRAVISADIGVGDAVACFFFFYAAWILVSAML
jgi:hypothetical protein